MNYKSLLNVAQKNINFKQDKVKKLDKLSQDKKFTINSKILSSLDKYKAIKPQLNSGLNSIKFNAKTISVKQNSSIKSNHFAPEKDKHRKLNSKPLSENGGNFITKKEVPKLSERHHSKLQNNSNKNNPNSLFKDKVERQQSVSFAQKPINLKRPPVNNTPTRVVINKQSVIQPPNKILPIKKPLTESEYESEEDDDYATEQVNYSKYIKEIFGYDKSKYRNIELDDVVETSFRDQMKEEARSARIGLTEDLEDIKLEKQKYEAKIKKLKTH